MRKITTINVNLTPEEAKAAIAEWLDAYADLGTDVAPEQIEFKISATGHRREDGERDFDYKLDGISITITNED